MNIQVDPTSSNFACAMLNSKIRPRAVVGYGVKIFHPSPPNYVTRSPGCVLIGERLKKPKDGQCVGFVFSFIKSFSVRFTSKESTKILTFKPGFHIEFILSRTKSCICRFFCIEHL